MYEISYQGICSSDIMLLLDKIIYGICFYHWIFAGACFDVNSSYRDSGERNRSYRKSIVKSEITICSNRDL